MHEYVHIPLPAPICVKDLVSVYHRDLHQHWSDGERLDFTELFYVESGSYSMMVGDTEYTLKPGQLVYLAPHTLHGSTRRNTACISLITFTADAPALQILYNRILTLSPKQAEQLREIIDMGVHMLVWHRTFNDYGFCLREDTDELTVQELKNKLELFLISLCRSIHQPASYNEALFLKLNQYLKAHIGDKLTLEHIADALSVSVSRLKHVCDAQCDTSPIDYFIALKITEAKRMLAETDQNVSQIAAALGFGSVHYFSRLFKAKTGLSPSLYAKRIEGSTTEAEKR